MLLLVLLLVLLNRPDLRVREGRVELLPGAGEARRPQVLLILPKDMFAVAPVPGPADAGDSDAEASVDTSAGTI